MDAAVPLSKRVKERGLKQKGLKRKIYRAPVDEYGISACRRTDCGIKQPSVQLGWTLPALLDEGYALNQSLIAGNGKKDSANKQMATVNQLNSRRWQSWTLGELRQAADEVALGLKSYIESDSATIESPVDATERERGIAIGDRVGLLMESNAHFVMADIGCLLAQLVTVPLSPEQSVEKSELMLTETAASVLFVSSLKQLRPLLPKLRLPKLSQSSRAASDATLSALRLIVVASVTDKQQVELDALKREFSGQGSGQVVGQLSGPASKLEIITLDDLREKANWSARQAQAMRTAISPDDLATIVYTLRENGRPLGAMLTHQNLSASVLAAFSTLPCLRKGPSEVALSFLPLHHIFARGFVYGSLSFGQSIYFSTPRLVMKHLKSLRPTVFLTVPRLLEKVYEGFEAAPEKLTRVWHWPQRLALAWAWQLAHRYSMKAAAAAEVPSDRSTFKLPSIFESRSLEPPSVQHSFWYNAQLWVARKTVLRPIRAVFGGRLACFISGGAALRPEVMTVLAASGLKLCQAYGLTETSSTLSFTRRHWQETGTVGVPMPGVELTLSDEDEVLVRAPYVMHGYYRAPEETQQVLLPDGWLRTGDKGRFSVEGLLTLTGYKKGLFKLSIGEYVAPLPLEAALRRSPLVKQALVVGPGRKFCAVLIFPDIEALANRAEALNLQLAAEQLMTHTKLLAAYQALINEANQGLPNWTTIKRFHLVDAQLDEGARPYVETSRAHSAEDREWFYQTFVHEIQLLYQPQTAVLTAATTTAAATNAAVIGPVRLPGRRWFRWWAKRNSQITDQLAGQLSEEPAEPSVEQSTA